MVGGIKGIKRPHSVALAVITSLIVTACMPASLSYSETGLLMPQRGMCYVTWEKHRFASQYSDESIKKMADLGVEYISICVTHYQEKYNSTDIKVTERTPSKKSLSHAIKLSHKLGMKVMLKPHVDLIDKFDGTYWRADIGFASEKDWQKWFTEYEKFILKYARMAKKLKVDIFCVGTELSFTTQKSSDWRRIISEVRKVYKGSIVYAANWDNYKNIEFWDALDYVGIDAYFPLSHKPSPTVEDLKEGWRKWKRDIEFWQKQINKPVIFTELGYPSSSQAPYTPWKVGIGGNADPEIQAKCYQAFFETIWDEPWFAGVYWWEWGTNVRSGGKHNRHFTPQNKPAQEIIEKNYKNLPKESAYASAK